MKLEPFVFLDDNLVSMNSFLSTMIQYSRNKVDFIVRHVGRSKINAFEMLDKREMESPYYKMDIGNVQKKDHALSG